MELVVLSKVAISLALVVLFMYALLKLIQKYTKFGTKSLDHSFGMKIEGIVYIDDQTKVVSLTRMDVNYVIAVSRNSVVLIDKYESKEKL